MSSSQNREARGYGSAVTRCIAPPRHHAPAAATGPTQSRALAHHCPRTRAPAGGQQDRVREQARAPARHRLPSDAGASAGQCQPPIALSVRANRRQSSASARASASGSVPSQVPAAHQAQQVRVQAPAVHMRVLGAASRPSSFRRQRLQRRRRRQRPGPRGQLSRLCQSRRRWRAARGGGGRR